jgi:hypothetical protein
MGLLRHLSTQKNYCFKRLQKCPHLFYTITTTAISFPAIEKDKIAPVSSSGGIATGLHYYLNENFVRKPILIARNNCTALI